MTFDAYWSALVRLKPRLADDTAEVTISAEAFRRLLRQAYTLGRTDVVGKSAKAFDFLDELTGRGFL